MNPALLLAIAGICITSAPHNSCGSFSDIGSISKKDVSKAKAVGRKAEALMAGDSESAEEDDDNILSKADTAALSQPDGLSGTGAGVNSFDFSTGGTETQKYHGSLAEMSPKHGYKALMGGAETRRGSKKAQDTWLKESKKLNKEKKKMEKTARKYSKS